MTETKTCAWCKQENKSEYSRFCSEECAIKAYNAHCQHEWWTQCCVPNLQQYKTPPEILLEKNPEAWAFASVWKREINIYAWGGEGVGKTSLCKYLLCKEVDKGNTVQAPTMLSLQSISKRYDSEDYLYDYVSCKTLLLDDIHDPCLTQSGYSVLRMLIDTRHEAGRRTLITTNKSPLDMTAHLNGICGEGFGIQFMRRLAPVKELPMTGTSYRKTINENVLSTLTQEKSL